MNSYTPHQSKYFAEQILLQRPQSSIDGLVSAMSGVKVDLNPHQVDAALFAVKSPLSTGALLADEVGLGKTIEAGLVLAQCWAERRRHILLIVPAALRMQWRSELFEKFYIDSLLMESAVYNKLRKEGVTNPFDVRDRVVICSYQFASKKAIDLQLVPWDLVIIDEAHRLRNVYKSNNVMGKKLKKVLAGRKKLLLTATPLQNNLMELYGLVSIIDDRVFGDDKTFREMYVAVANSDIRNQNLRRRLAPLCKRTLRKQVSEYVRYTGRHAILREYTPTADEEKLYNEVSEYLQTDKLYALPDGQRTLITMVLRKLLASSSFAIAGTLQSLIDRLNDLLEGVEAELSLDDYDGFDEHESEHHVASEFTFHFGLTRYAVVGLADSDSHTDSRAGSRNSDSEGCADSLSRIFAESVFGRGLFRSCGSIFFGSGLGRDYNVSFVIGKSYRGGFVVKRLARSRRRLRCRRYGHNERDYGASERDKQECRKSGLHNCNGCDLSFHNCKSP